MYNDDDVFKSVHNDARVPYAEWVEAYQTYGSRWPKSLPDCINDGDLIHVEWSNETQAWEQVK